MLFNKVELPILLFILVVLILSSCGEDSSKEKAIKLDLVPDRITKQSTITYKDSGKIVFILQSDLIKEYESIESPYTIFPKGIEINFLDKKNEKGKVISKWAKWSKKRNLYELRDQVLVVNKDNDTLKTDTLYWDKERRSIFTKDTVTIIRADGSRLTAIGGMESTEDFKEYTFKKNSGEIFLKNKEF